MPALAIYKAMLDLKRAVNIKVFFNGHASAYQYNTIFGIKKHFPSFSKGKTLLKHNQVSFEYCNIDAHSMFDKREDIKVMRELKSRCYQIMNYSRMRDAVCEIEYDELTHIEKKTNQG